MGVAFGEKGSLVLIITALAYLCAGVFYVGTVVGFVTGYFMKKPCGNWLMFYCVILGAVVAIVLFLVALILAKFKGIGQTLSVIIYTLLVNFWMACNVCSYAIGEG